jgi:hypothetical protein
LEQEADSEPAVLVACLPEATKSLSQPARVHSVASLDCRKKGIGEERAQ